MWRGRPRPRTVRSVTLLGPMPRRSQPLRIAIDTGGTFTDCVWMEPDRGRLRMLKVFSTPADPSQAIVEALRQITEGIAKEEGKTDKTALPGELILLHGTTVGTNTLLERKGARTALVTTAGFEDAIEIGRQVRPKLYDFFFDRIEPLVAKDLRFGINERTASDGEILTSPTPQELHSLSEKLAARPESIAISLLFSFANPGNEEVVAQALKPLAVPLSISHQILPEFREYERTSTVVINAYLQPVMQRYLENLQFRADELTRRRDVAGNASLSTTTTGVAAGDSPARFGVARSGAARSGAARFVEERRFSAAKSAQKDDGALAPARIFVMQSSGGITALSTAAREPVRTVLSGPAGGVVGAAATARASGFDRIIAFDMGGTSTDVSLVEGEIKTATDAQIAGLPIGVPMLDIHTVGAGGGSLARFDAAGVLHVGPESAGADPGPICYGRGLRPTVTDANLLLGRLQPTRFLGGDFTLDLDRTRHITQGWLKKERSRLTLQQFAAGVIRVVNATMEKAIRVVSIERGRDPRHFALVAFGGAGGLHACALAEALSIPHVIVPAFPGALSALGILASNVVKDYSRTVLWSVSGKIPTAQLNQEFAALEETAAKDFRRELWQGRPHYARSIDLRYLGQGYELNIPATKNLLKDFQQEHHRRYGYTHPHREVELVTLRLRATLRTTTAHMGTGAFASLSRAKPRDPGRTKLGRLSLLEAPVLFDGKKLKTKIHSRDDLRPGRKYPGPAIISEYSATTVVPPHSRFHLDRAANLVISLA
jgi:N-methylhydantoinase A